MKSMLAGIQQTDEEFRKRISTQLCQTGIVMVYSIVESGIKKFAGLEAGYLSDALKKLQVLQEPLPPLGDKEKHLRELLDEYAKTYEDDPPIELMRSVDTPEMTQFIYQYDIEELKCLANDLKHKEGKVTHQDLITKFGWTVGSVIGDDQKTGNQKSAWGFLFRIEYTPSVFFDNIVEMLGRITPAVYGNLQQQNLLTKSKLSTLLPWVILEMHRNIDSLALPSTVDTSQYSHPAEKAFHSYYCSANNEVKIITQLVKLSVYHGREEYVEEQQALLYQVAIVLLHLFVERQSNSSRIRKSTISLQDQDITERLKLLESECQSGKPLSAEIRNKVYNQSLEIVEFLQKNDIVELEKLYNVIKHHDSFISDSSDSSEPQKWLLRHGYGGNQEIAGQKAKDAFRRISKRVPMYLACLAKEAALNP